MLILDLVKGLAAQYNEPMKFKKKINGQIENIPNIKILNLLDYMSDEFADNTSRIDKFYKKILRAFKPTSANPFPTPANLEEIKNIEESPDYGSIKQIDFDGIVEKFADESGIKYNSPDNKKFDIKKAALDNDRLNAKEMMMKYGVKNAGIIWELEGKVASEKGKWEYKGLKPEINKDFMLSLHI